jgi:hypothetical protein
MTYWVHARRFSFADGTITVACETPADVLALVKELLKGEAAPKKRRCRGPSLRPSVPFVAHRANACRVLMERGPMLITRIGTAAGIPRGSLRDVFADKKMFYRLPDRRWWLVGVPTEAVSA